MWLFLLFTRMHKCINSFASNKFGHIRTVLNVLLHKLSLLLIKQFYKSLLHDLGLMNWDKGEEIRDRFFATLADCRVESKLLHKVNDK
jgi:hypothetical protein